MVGRLGQKGKNRHEIQMTNQMAATQAIGAGMERGLGVGAGTRTGTGVVAATRGHLDTGRSHPNTRQLNQLAMTACWI